MNRTSPVVFNLLIINVLLFAATYFWRSGNNPLMEYLALYYPESSSFRPYQFITHMFMHGGFSHILFNMYALWMFGTAIESVWGGKRFLFYYFFTGLGAAALHTFVNYLVFRGINAEIVAFGNTPSPELFRQFIESHAEKGFSGQFLAICNNLFSIWSDAPGNTSYAHSALELMRRIADRLMDIPTVGASGAIFGLLLAFGMMYPNTRLMIIFLPIAIKAKWFVLIYGAIELFLGFSQPGSSFAHFAHIGGMLFGYLLIRFWIYKAKKNRYG
ncbi:MAG: rhomboid family intramembrane serine protease [Bacteroidales bacterium]|jgi:membrane associated rhomboid family serine protease|nr:rhomboid family intramembrane serine protease [Bacteroidales bacterium]